MRLPRRDAAAAMLGGKKRAAEETLFVRSCFVYCELVQRFGDACERGCR